MDMFDHMQICSAMRAIEKAEKAHPEDGVIYSDDIVEVRRENGKTIFHGRPIRFPITYVKA